MVIRRILQTGLLGMTLAGCSAVDLPRSVSSADYELACGQLQQLLEDYRRDFAGVRYESQAGRGITRWRASVHFSGDNCEVWEQGYDRWNYACVYKWPERTAAIDAFKRARSVAKRCLGGDWNLRDSSKRGVEGTSSHFSREGHPAVSIHALATPNVVAAEWSFYFLLGDTRSLLSQ